MRVPSLKCSVIVFRCAQIPGAPFATFTPKFFNPFLYLSTCEGSMLEWQCLCRSRLTTASMSSSISVMQVTKACVVCNSFTHTCVIDPMPIADGQFPSPSSVVGDDEEKVLKNSRLPVLQKNIEQATAVTLGAGMRFPCCRGCILPTATARLPRAIW